jgi:predicted sulfurtransferase
MTVLFYKYTQIDSPVEVADWVRLLCVECGLLGRAIIADEGINANLSASSTATQVPRQGRGL